MGYNNHINWPAIIAMIYPGKTGNKHVILPWCHYMWLLSGAIYVVSAL